MADVVPIREKIKEGITVCRLVDNKLSVRYDGDEVCILPNRLTCTEWDIEAAFKAVVGYALNVECDDIAADTYADIEKEMRRDLSQW